MVVSSGASTIACLQLTDQSSVEAAAARLGSIAERTDNPQVAEARQRVDAILQQVAEQGDQALLELSERFDGVRPDPLRIPAEQLEAAWRSCGADLRDALDLAHRRILDFHRRQLPADLSVRGPHGELVGRRWRLMLCTE